MISLRLFIIGFTFLTFISCNDITTEKNETKESKITNLKKVDSASESTMLNPQIDVSKIYGFGVFKIGTSIDSSISFLIKTKGYKFDSILNYDKKLKFELDHPIIHKSKYIFKLNHAKSTLETNLQVEHSSWCKDSKIYWITSYNIDNINIENLYLTYYKNKLVYIRCNRSSDLVTAIITKFGKPDEDIHETKHNYNYISKQWFNNDIKAGYTNSALSSLTGDLFEIEINGGHNYLKGCSGRCYEEQNKIDKELLKAKLKNF